jgi:drug/metabolite transporter (DMT)-like permease
LAIEEPLAAPPNWIDFRLHSPVCLALFALLNGLLGVRLARDRPAGDVGVHWLWLLGLASAVAFLVPMMVAEALVRASAGTNGALAAWAPLAVPLAALSVATGLTGRYSPREHGAGPAPPGGRA